MKNALKVTGILLVIVAGIVIILLFLVNHFFFSTSHLPKGKLLVETVSPNGDSTVNTFLTNGGATVSYAVRGEVVYHKKKDNRKNIYWQYREDQAEVVWIDDHIVSINGIELDVRNDVYDWRKEK